MWNHTRLHIKWFENSYSNKVIYKIALTYITFAGHMNGRSHVIAIDYDRYFIGKHCADEAHEGKYVPLECYRHATNRTILGTSQIFENRLLGSSWLSVHPSFSIEQLGSHWTNFVKFDIWDPFQNLLSKFILG